MGEATLFGMLPSCPAFISIHASRGGSDSNRADRKAEAGYFNPRFPWGKRQQDNVVGMIIKQFQSTLPVGEATYFSPANIMAGSISIHASRGGSDTIGILDCSSCKNFNPRFPWGKRRLGIGRNEKQVRFQSTLPVGEATAPGRVL